MEKTLTYEEYVRVKNLLTKIKSQLGLMDESKEEITKSIDDINNILSSI